MDHLTCAVVVEYNIHANPTDLCGSLPIFDKELTNGSFRYKLREKRLRKGPK
jgi:hypothetical protein